MVVNVNYTEAPAGWLEILAESEADLVAGRIVPGEIVMRELRDGLASAEAKAAAKPKRKAAARGFRRRALIRKSPDPAGRGSRLAAIGFPTAQPNRRLS